MEGDSSFLRRCSGPRLLLCLSAFVFLWGISQAQVIVLEPSDLAVKFPKGRIDGSTAAFGTPYYGERITGNLLFFDKTGCEEDDYHFEIPEGNPNLGSTSTLDPTKPPRRNLDPISESFSESISEPSRQPHTRSSLRTVVMVRRGECHFVTKVLVAEKKGATAVVIVDSEGSMTTKEDVKNIIMADDGWGDGVVIPSLIIGEIDGSLLIGKLLEGKRVIVELAWDVPTSNTAVTMDQWLSPAFAETNKFLKEFAPYAKQLKHKLNYRPHYVVMTLPGDFKDMCTDSSGRFCGWDPDKGGKTTGKEIMQETVRQLCLWEATQSLDASDSDSGFYSESWWSYVEQLGRECPHKGNAKFDLEEASRKSLTLQDFEENHTLGETCSYNLMRKVGANLTPVKQCISQKFDSLLDHQLLNKAWSATAIMINDWRYSGPDDPEMVTRTLCLGFDETPNECNELFHPSLAELRAAGMFTETVEGFPVWAVVFLIILGVLLGILLAGALYWYCLHPKIRSTLRYNIMEEVRKETVPYDISTTTTSADFGIPSRAGFYGSTKNTVSLPMNCLPAGSPSPSPSPLSAADATTNSAAALATRSKGLGDVSNRAAPVGRKFDYWDDLEESAEEKKVEGEVVEAGRY